VRGLCAWALGKLACKEAYGDLVKAMEASNPEVRSWSAWALGEIGLYDAVSPLGRALETERNPAVRRAIGGALKKLRLEPTREHVTAVVRRLSPPATRNGRTQLIVQDLASLGWPLDKEAIVELRKQLQETDPAYFTAYIEWLCRKPSIEGALLDRKKVYSDFE
jgi:HEAT repeat protein